MVINLVIAFANLRPWWKGSRDLKLLVPWGEGLLLGAFGTMCVGGILGWLTGCAPTVTNGAGDHSLKAVTGQGNSSPLAHGALQGLTPNGAIVVFLGTVAFCLIWKSAGKADKKRMTGGLVNGSCLCVTAGIASLLNWLPGLVNQGGDQIVSAFNGLGGLL
ncbi:hypothetical protein ACFYM2_21200 [Streptomyces sp. NPDC006711]|uniref:hypothetical protein n=1 Tax=Streptomyces sp. NPDC006711 TaxID=3364762 RepID=UPI0036AD055A